MARLAIHSQWDHFDPRLLATYLLRRKASTRQESYTDYTFGTRAPVPISESTPSHLLQQISHTTLSKNRICNTCAYDITNTAPMKLNCMWNLVCWLQIVHTRNIGIGIVPLAIPNNYISVSDYLFSGAWQMHCKILVPRREVLTTP